MQNIIRELAPEMRDELLETLKLRFELNMERHEDLEWEIIEKRLVVDAMKLWSLNQMERTGGEPDVVGYNENSGEYLFYDCSAESPIGRRNICYDHEAQESRKKYKPDNNAMDMAADMGIDILTVKQYRELQNLGEFDTKTSSWIKTPLKIRRLGGALFCDRRYDSVFVYHNGAETYYTSRGFRGLLRV